MHRLDFSLDTENGDDHTWLENLMDEISSDRYSTRRDNHRVEQARFEDTEDGQLSTYIERIKKISLLLTFKCQNSYEARHTPLKTWCTFIQTICPVTSSSSALGHSSVKRWNPDNPCKMRCSNKPNYRNCMKGCTGK